MQTRLNVLNMLILKAFVNEKEIDEIHIQNIEYIGNGIYEYKIKKPEGDWPVIHHKRKDGWRKLALRVLYVLNGYAIGGIVSKEDLIEIGWCR